MDSPWNLVRPPDANRDSIFGPTDDRPRLRWRVIRLFVDRELAGRGSFGVFQQAARHKGSGRSDAALEHHGMPWLLVNRRRGRFNGCGGGGYSWNSVVLRPSPPPHPCAEHSLSRPTDEKTRKKKKKRKREGGQPQPARARTQGREWLTSQPASGSPGDKHRDP